MNMKSFIYFFNYILKTKYIIIYYIYYTFLKNYIL